MIPTKGMWGYRLYSHQEVGSSCTLFSSQKRMPAFRKSTKTDSFLWCDNISFKRLTPSLQATPQNTLLVGWERLGILMNKAAPGSVCFTLWKVKSLTKSSGSNMIKGCKELSFFGSFYS